MIIFIHIYLYLYLYLYQYPNHKPSRSTLNPPPPPHVFNLEHRHSSRMCGIFAYCNFLCEKVSIAPARTRRRTRSTRHPPLATRQPPVTLLSNCTLDEQLELTCTSGLIVNRIDRRSATSSSKASPDKNTEVTTRLVSLILPILRVPFPLTVAPPRKRHRCRW